MRSRYSIRREMMDQPSSECLRDENWPKQLMSSLHLLQYNNVKCDSCLVGTDGGKTVAHGIVLAAASPFLSNRLWGIGDSVMDIDAKSDAIKKVVNFIYSGEIIASEYSSWPELLNLARHLQIPSLVAMCSQQVDALSSPHCMGQRPEAESKPDSSFSFFDTKSDALTPSTSVEMGLSPNPDAGASCSKTEPGCFDGVTTLGERMESSSSESSVFPDMKLKRLSPPSLDIHTHEAGSISGSLGVGSSDDGHQSPVSASVSTHEAMVSSLGMSSPDSKHTPVKIARQKEGFIGDCSECGLLLGSPEAARLHRNVHTGHKPYICELCNKEFDSKRALTIHMRNIHEEVSGGMGTFPCGICGKILASKIGLKIHVDTHSTYRRKYVCNICSKVLTTPLGLKNHELNHRAIKETFSCQICGKVLTTKLGLKLHEFNHSGVKQSFFCQYCNKKLTTKLGLQLHEESHRNTSGRHQCHICNQVMPSALALRSHITSQHDDTPGTFECQVCKKLLTSRANLQAHEQMHSETKTLYQCNFCHKSLSTKSSLKLHEDLHWRPDKAQFPCPICSMVFTTRASCELHHMEHIRQANEITRAIHGEPI